MRKLSELSNPELAEFLLNGKSGDCLELNSDQSENTEGFRTIYKDKHMTIMFSSVTTPENEEIANFFIYSKWWGRIKNSFFTIETRTGKWEHVRCGVISSSLLNEWITKDTVPVNNTNQAIAIDSDVIDFDSFAKSYQKIHKVSPTYKVINVIRQSPNPWVEIEITVGDSKKRHCGTNKKEAANNWAVIFGHSYL